MRDWLDEFWPLLALVSAVVLLLELIFACAWFEGHAKSKYLHQTQGVEMPWYEAAFIEVQINSVNAKVESK